MKAVHNRLHRTRQREGPLVGTEPMPVDSAVPSHAPDAAAGVAAGGMPPGAMTSLTAALVSGAGGATDAQ